MKLRELKQQIEWQIADLSDPNGTWLDGYDILIGDALAYNRGEIVDILNRYTVEPHHGSELFDRLGFDSGAMEVTRGYYGGKPAGDDLVINLGIVGEIELWGDPDEFSSRENQLSVLFPDVYFSGAGYGYLNMSDVTVDYRIKERQLIQDIIDAGYLGEPGTVYDRATLKTDDLIDGFLTYIDRNLDRCIRVDDLLADTPIKRRRMRYGGEMFFSFTEDGDLDPWYETEEASYFLESLFDLLNQYAPPGHYFGSNPGNGSDFGYWPYDDEMEAVA